PAVDEMLRVLEHERARGLELIAAASSHEELERAEIAVLGRKSPLASVQRGLGALADEDRRRVGQRTNEEREALRSAIAERRSVLDRSADDRLIEADALDVTLPGRRPRPGSLHPLKTVRREVADIVLRRGYQAPERPEV